MRTVAFATLGCKVNQYDTQAMLEQFLAAGYEVRPFSGRADVYVVNTCTVTGTGDKKSMQTLRRALSKNPGAVAVVAGCLAQRQGEGLLLPGVMLVLGTGRRSQVVDLLHAALESGQPMVAVEDFASAEGAIYEPLFVRRHAERTRAVLKIQEGCDCRCSYCVIPSVRGPIRSSPLDQIRAQAEELARAGYREVVLTGIHLSSYGRDFTPRRSLLDAIDAVHAVPGVERIRLGSLEPRVVTAEFVEALGKREKVCPQFHLSLQSGSDTILRAMRRQYSVRQYEAACALLRQSYPRVALTTDIMTGFPGEGEAEFQQTLDTVRRIRFARIHVFPYSEREGTDAATYPHAVPKAEREARARRLIALGEEQQRTYIDSMVGGGYPVLIEEAAEGLGVGYTPEYVRAHVPGGEPGEIAWIRALEAREEALWGERTEGEER